MWTKWCEQVLEVKYDENNHNLAYIMPSKLVPFIVDYHNIQGLSHDIAHSGDGRGVGRVKTVMSSFKFVGASDGGVVPYQSADSVFPYAIYDGPEDNATYEVHVLLLQRTQRLLLLLRGCRTLWRRCLPIGGRCCVMVL